MKNRYIFISDTHGCYTKMIKALKKIKFNEQTDTLVLVGDAFDRGSENFEILQYVLNLPNKILIWGNHDARLYDLVTKRKSLSWYDTPNGTVNTIREFGETINVYDAIENIYNKKTKASKLLDQYFQQCYFALEFEDLIATHGWLPYDYFVNTSLKNISRDEWVEATWSNTEAELYSLDMIPKPILVGHYHAFRIAEDCYHEDRHSKDDKKIDTSIFISPDKKLICIDGCSNLKRGQVITYVYESSKKPKLYK